MTDFVDFGEESTHEAEQRGSKSWLVIPLLLFIAALIVGLGFVVNSMLNHPDKTETLRDIVIIFMAVETLIIGLVLVLLIVQVARLTAMLQNEIKPIIDTTNETINTLRGTSKFLSDNMVQPVMKANSSLAAIRHAFKLIKPGRSKKR